MAIKYNISTWTSSTAMQAREYRSVKRIDAAFDECWKQLYEMIAADGGLDTERGKRLEREFDAMVSDHKAYKTIGKTHYFARKFVLRTDQYGDCANVLFVAVRH